MRSSRFVLSVLLSATFGFGSTMLLPAQAPEQDVAQQQEKLRQVRASHDRKTEAETLCALGQTYHRRGKPEKAQEVLNEAILLQVELGDRLGEAATLTSLAQVYTDTGKPARALALLDRATSIEEQTSDHSGASDTLTALGQAYAAMGENKKALEFLGRALTLHHELGHREAEARTLTAIGEATWGLGESIQALDFYNEALSIQRAAGDHGGEAITLNDIGAYYWGVGQPQKALDYYNQAIPLERLAGDRDNEAATLVAAGVAYAGMGQSQKALSCFDQAIPIAREVGDVRNLAYAMHAAGAAYQDLNQFRKALSFYQQAIPIWRKVGDRAAEANTLSNMATAYYELGQPWKALPLFYQLLPIQRKAGDRRSEAITLYNMASSYKRAGLRDKALKFYKLALPIEQETNDRLIEAYTLWRLADLRTGDSILDFAEALRMAKDAGSLELQGLIYTSLMKRLSDEYSPDAAIFFGKQAINAYQQIRKNMHGLEPGLDNSYVQFKGDTYRALTKLFVDQGRIAEAELVIRMLKQEEYAEFTRGEGGADGQGTLLKLTPAEQKAESITAEELAWAGLRAVKTRNEEQQKQFETLGGMLRQTNQSFDQTIRSALAHQEAQKDVFNYTSIMQNILDQAQRKSPDTVGVYTLVFDNELDLIVVTSRLKVPPHRVAVSRRELNGKVMEFRRLLQDPCSDPKPAALALYKLIVAPVLKDLAGAQAKTIVWELDGALRYVPISALYDGHQYLAEQYSNVLFSSTNPSGAATELNRSNWNAVGFGASQPQNDLPALSAVPGELEGIIHDTNDPSSSGPLPGRIFLDQSFTPHTMESELGSGFPVVHIASHFVLKPGSDQSYLLFGSGDPGHLENNKLTYAELRDSVAYRFDGVELLTLSACETGAGSGGGAGIGKELDALGDLAQVKGAKAVLATLWDVNDASTGQLMTDFYQKWIKSDGTLKVEALRQAQVNMLRNGQSVKTHFACRVAMTHPYYWAPFILIGNWQ